MGVRSRRRRRDRDLGQGTLDRLSRVVHLDGRDRGAAPRLEIAISVKGRGTDYHVSFPWMDEIEALHLACAFDLKVPEPRRAEVLALIALVNEQLWVGHFDMWTKDGIVMFRHALLLAGGVEVAGRQCEALLDAALETSERYFQAFQFVVWAGKNAREALDATMFETAGEA